MTIGLTVRSDSFATNCLKIDFCCIPINNISAKWCELKVSPQSGEQGWDWPALTQILGCQSAARNKFCHGTQTNLCPFVPWLSWILRFWESTILHWEFVFWFQQRIEKCLPGLDGGNVDCGKFFQFHFFVSTKKIHSGLLGSLLIL